MTDLERENYLYTLTSAGLTQSAAERVLAIAKDGEMAGFTSVFGTVTALAQMLPTIPAALERFRHSGGEAVSALNLERENDITSIAVFIQRLPPGPLVLTAFPVGPPYRRWKRGQKRTSHDKRRAREVAASRALFARLWEAA